MTPPPSSPGAVEQARREPRLIESSTSITMCESKGNSCSSMFSLDAPPVVRPGICSDSAPEASQVKYSLAVFAIQPPSKSGAQSGTTLSKRIRSEAVSPRVSTQSVQPCTVRSSTSSSLMAAMRASPPIMNSRNARRSISSPSSPPPNAMRSTMDPCRSGILIGSGMPCASHHSEKGPQ